MHVDVPVTGGVVRGELDADVAAFRGIPYATLPARLCAPHPVSEWAGVREATRFGPAPPQSGALGPVAPDTGDHEWLTVNVWSADLSGSRPVMVWIQGGAYSFGTSGLPEYDGRRLARDGVVLVTFNYRVGLEGFGFVDGTPANRGLLDQVAALEWVQRNAAAFGGDPGRVTVFGQSAGAGCVAALLAMPRAAGLFRRAVAQSVPGPFLTPALAADVSRECARALGVTPADLPTVDARVLSSAGTALLDRVGELADRWGAAAHARVPIAPVVDCEVLPTTPWRGLTGDVDLVVGHTRHEQRLLMALDGRLGQVTADDADEAVRVFAPDPARYEARYPDPEERYEVVRSDWLFRMPSLKLAEAQLAAGGRAFLYELAWPAPGLGGALGACHGLDVPLVFGNLTAGQPAVLIGESVAEASAISRRMRRAWTAFAATGDPGWPGFETGATRLFDVEDSVTDYPERVSREAWQGEYPRVLDLG